MANALPIVGVNSVFKLIPIGGGSTITLKNSNWEINLDPNIKEAPNTTDGMLRTLGLFDYSGNVKGWTDATSVSTGADAQAKPGNFYTFQAYRSSVTSLFFSGTIVMGTLKIATGVDDLETWSFDFMKQSGVLTYPDGTTQ